MAPVIPRFREVYVAARPIYLAALEHVEPHTAMHAVEYVLTWAWLTDHDGREPTAVRHQNALGCSRATYYRRRADFRRAFPDARTPLAVEGAREISRAPAAASLGALNLA